MEGYATCLTPPGSTTFGNTSTTFRPYVPDQSLLLPPDVREWLPEGHLAHHVSDLVDGLDLTAFYALYEGDGRRNAPYEPRMMVKVLRAGSLGNWKRTLRSGCWRRTTFRNTGRCASFGGGTWRISRRCSWRWSVWLVAAR